MLSTSIYFLTETVKKMLWKGYPLPASTQTFLADCLNHPFEIFSRAIIERKTYFRSNLIVDSDIIGFIKNSPSQKFSKVGHPGLRIHRFT